MSRRLTKMRKQDNEYYLMRGSNCRGEDTTKYVKFNELIR